MKKANKLFLIVFGLIITTSCNSQENHSNVCNSDSDSSLYFGQPIPDKKAKPFAPDILSFEPHDSPIISLDEKYMIIGTTEQDLKFLTMNDSKLKLSENPMDFEIPFSDTPYSYNGMYISPSGNRIYFRIWLNNDEKFYFIEKTENSWNSPRLLGEEVNSYKTHWQFSVANNENLYFSSDGIKVSKYDGVKYLKPASLINEDNIAISGGTPFIAPDESYIIISIDNDLFISYNLKNGTWTTPKNLGADINSEYMEICPIVSPNEKYLFFITRRNSPDFSIYWADASFIEKLKPKE